MTKDIIIEYLSKHKQEFQEKYGLEAIGLFGSYARDDFDEYSDVDIAVKFDSNYLDTHDVWDYFDTINSIKDNIMEKFHLKSDIFDLDSISPLKEQIQKDIVYV